jgi:hypothetical protein
LLALAGLVVVLVHANANGSRGARSASDGRTAPATSAPPPAPSPSPSFAATPPSIAPVPTITPELPSDDTQAQATARQFLTAYLTAPAADTPALLQARVRPFDTDRLDKLMGQGGGPGAPAAASTATISSLVSTGLAPDGRLVLVANVSITQGGVATSRYVELYLARQHDAWRVDEVAL